MIRLLAGGTHLLHVTMKAPVTVLTTADSSSCNHPQGYEKRPLRRHLLPVVPSV